MLGQPVCTEKGKRRGRHFSAWCRPSGAGHRRHPADQEMKGDQHPYDDSPPRLSGHEFGALKAHALQRSSSLTWRNMRKLVEFGSPDPHRRGALVAEFEHGRVSEAAICETCMLHFRLYLTTTLTAIVGAVPLALGTGVGAELRQPLGIAISAVPWWVSSLSLDRFRPRPRLRERRTVSRLLARSATRGAVTPAEQ